MTVSASQQQTAQDFVLALVRALCDQPDAVSVQAIDAERDASCKVTLSEGDYERLIGGKGRPVRSLSTIVNAAFGRPDRRLALEFHPGQ